MSGYMGYKNKAEFQRAINRELGRMASHDRGARERQAKAKPKEETVKLRGEPGSMERFLHVAEQVGDKTLVAELAYGQVGQHLQNTLHAIRAVENSDYFDGTYPPEV